MGEHLKKAVGYCRFSSNNQREESIDAQKRAIKFYAQQEGYDIIYFYEDRAISGKTANHRPAFMQMMEDSAKKKFQFVLVHKLDRFSRDAGDSLNYEKKLKMCGVQLVSVMERLDSSPTGNMMKMIIAAINTFYSANLAIEVTKGLKENAYNCRATGGTPPLGYDIVDKKYVINEHESGAIRLIFEMYDSGYGYGTIMDKLNQLNYKTKIGNPFGKNSLYEILHNERYKGVFIYNKHSPRRPDGSRNRAIKPDEEIIRIPGGIQAIIDEDVWERCNARMLNNKRNSGRFKAKEIYLLSGLIYCGECGHAMHGNGRYPAPDRPKLITYRCSYKDNNRACKNKEIKRDLVEGFVIDQLQKYLFSEDIISELTNRLNEYIALTSDSVNDDKNRYAEHLTDLNRKKGNLVEAITNTGYAASLGEKLAELEASIETVRSKLANADHDIQSDVVTEEMVGQYLSGFKEVLSKRDMPQIKRLIEAYVERVDVYHDEMTATFKIELPIRKEGNPTYHFERNIRRNGLKAIPA